ncbi:Four helix bundle protein [Nitrosomonas nitrosa]|uniref:Four helix bundle protein n=2 Tax=Nitrosomonas nitrosa TaxID=52442 RepID=A0A8H8Z3H6_9PROT|nr:Four helix bundle protein [Nitrosomonas nitrosa]
MKWKVKGKIMTVKNYRELIIWQKAMDLVELIYQVTKNFPKEELYGLTSQIRRAAVSIPSNIAEGQARQSTSEFRNFLSIAQGSRAEVETQLMIAQRLDYLPQQKAEQILNLSEEIKRMIYSLTSKL